MEEEVAPLPPFPQPQPPEAGMVVVGGELIYVTVCEV